jgi:Fic family protein
MLLGSVKAKCDQLEGVPLKPLVARRMHEAIFIKGAHATTAIEGNTLTESQVGQIARQTQLELPLAMESERREAANVIAQFNEIGQDARRPDSHGELSMGLIKEANAALLEGIPQLPENAPPGAIRNYPVGVNGANYKGAPWQDCPYLLNKLCAWLNELTLGQGTDQKVSAAILRALLVHLYIAWIHPFADGNGRTARLLEFFSLIHDGIPHLAVHLLSNHYHRTRSEYYKMLAHSSKSGGDVLPFLTYALKGFDVGIDEQLATIRSQHIEISWDDYIYQIFDQQHSPAANRKKQVILALSRSTKPTRRKDIRFLNPIVADCYGGKTNKTITRDLNALISLDLIKKVPGGYAANTDLVLAFLS